MLQGATYGMATLLAGLVAIPILFLIWRMIDKPRGYIPVFILVAMMLLLETVDEVIGPNAIANIVHLIPIFH